MVPVVAQIETVTPIRARVVNTEVLPQVADGELRLTVKTDTHEVLAALVDTQTNEVIREIPAEEMRRAAEVMRAIIGHLIDKVA